MKPRVNPINPSPRSSLPRAVPHALMLEGKTVEAEKDLKRYAGADPMLRASIEERVRALRQMLSTPQDRLRRPAPSP